MVSAVISWFTSRIWPGRHEVDSVATASAMVVAYEVR
jgi:hypothetical protein